LIKGLSYDVIAERTFHAASTVKKQAKEIYKKFKVKNKKQFLDQCIEHKVNL
jgi:DNA-binding NarL/FixJ family response regulator